MQAYHLADAEAATSIEQQALQRLAALRGKQDALTIEDALCLRERTFDCAKGFAIRLAVAILRPDQ